MSTLVATASEDEPLANDKIQALLQALTYLENECDAEELSYSELADIDALYNIIEGRY